MSLRRISSLQTALALLLTTTFFFSGGKELPAASNPVKKEPEAVIVAMGDSLTAGFGLPERDAYPALLENLLAEKGYPCRVINAGVSGETSSGALSRLQWVLRLKPDVVLLATGANDGLRGIDPEILENNLNQIIQILKENDALVILAGMQMVHNLGETYTEAFRAVYPRVAARQEVPLIPFLLEGVAGDPRLNLPDGIHPNRAGHEKIAETVLPFVLETLKALRSRTDLTVKEAAAP